MKTIDIIKENKNIIEKMTGFKIYFTKENPDNFPVRIVGGLMCCPTIEFALSEDKQEFISTKNRAIIYFET
jgi:hypothetical protein